MNSSLTLLLLAVTLPSAPQGTWVKVHSGTLVNVYVSDMRRIEAKLDLKPVSYVEFYELTVFDKPMQNKSYQARIKKKGLCTTRTTIAETIVSFDKKGKPIGQEIIVAKEMKGVLDLKILDHVCRIAKL
jgi:hypothetical protein